MCCYADWLLTSENGKIAMEKARLKAVLPRKQFEQYKKERKGRVKLTTLIESVKKVCHDYIKLRDKGKAMCKLFSSLASRNTKQDTFIKLNYSVQLNSTKIIYITSVFNAI